MSVHAPFATRFESTQLKIGLVQKVSIMEEENIWCQNVSQRRTAVATPQDNLQNTEYRP